MFKFLKLFCVFNASVGTVTDLVVSAGPNVVKYDITKDMIKNVKYNDFNSWSTIPWNSAYFDVDQPDLKLVSGYFYDFYNPTYKYFLNYVSDVSGVLKKHVDFNNYLFFNDDQLNAFSRIMFNHNLIQSNQKNYFEFGSNIKGQRKLDVKLKFQISKPLSFYIQGFMFYFDFLNFGYLGSTFLFSFLDYAGNVEYDFRGEVGSQYLKDVYNFITMPVRVPNLKYLTVDFDILSTIRNPQQSASVRFGQLNIFSSQEINPVPADSPFNPEYERPSWYDVFGHLRNAFRWVLYGVVGKVLPVEPLRQFLFTTDSLLRHIFSDTISTALNVDIVSGIENIIPLWLFVRAISLIVG